MQNNLEEKLKELKKAYIVNLKTSILELKENFDSNNPDVVQIYSKVHKIAGTSGMYGFVELSKEANEFEFYLNVVKDNLESINKVELCKKFDDFVICVEKIICGEY